MKTRLLFFALTVLLSLWTENLGGQTRPPLFEETFESVMSGIPDGWSNDSVEGNAKWGYYRGGVDGSVCMAYETDYRSKFNFLVSPEINVGDGQMLSFDYMSTAHGVLTVYVSYDGGRTFQSQPLVDGLPQSSWTRTEVALPHVGGTVFGFMAKEFEEGVSFQVYVDNVRVEPQPRCATPTGLSANNISMSSVDLTYTFGTMGYIPDNVEVSLKMNGSDADGYSVSTPYAGLTTLSGLDYDTEYTVKIRMDCDASYLGKSEWSEEISFRTRCEEKELPQYYIFDDWDAVSSCWTAKRNGASEKLTLSSTNGYGGAGKALEVAGGSGDVYIYTEPIGHAANDMEISFYAYTDKSSNAVIEIGVQGDAEQPGTYSKIEEIELMPKEWNKVVVYTEDALLGAETGAVVAIWVKSFGYNKLYIDNLSLEELPGCKRPRNVKVSSFTHESVSFEWDADEGATLAVYSVSGQDSTLLGKVTEKDNVITGLNASTEYTFAFKSVCQDGVESAWSLETVIQKTECAPKDALSVAYDFDDGTVPDCWDMDIYEGWSYNTNQVHGGKYSLKANATRWNPISCMRLPYVNIPEEYGYQLVFWMYRDETYGAKEDHVNVWVNTSPDTVGGTVIGTVYREISIEPAVLEKGWYKYDFTIPMDGDIYIILEGVSAGGNSIYIDDLAVIERPSCMKPSEIHIEEVKSSSVKVVWTPQTDESKWEITYEYTGLSNPVTEIVSGTPEYIITGLDGNTAYDMTISVAAVCSEGDTSEVLTKYLPCETPCVPVDVSDVPFKEDFEDNHWNCYTVLESYALYSTVYPYVSSSGINVFNNNVFALPEFIYKNGRVQDYRLWFDVQVSLSSDIMIYVGVLDDLSDKESFVAVDSMKPEYGSHQYKVQFDKYKGTGSWIAFKVVGASTTSIKNIIVEQLPDCPDVTSVNVTGLTNSSADITIESDGATRYDLQFGSKGFALGSGTTISGRESPARIFPLEADTEYDIYVRSDCGGEKNGAWSDVSTFRTRCNPVSVTVDNPFFDGFEDESISGLGCWVEESVGGAVWQLERSANVFEGTTSLALVPQGSGQYKSVIYHPVDLKGGTQYEFSCVSKASSDVASSILELITVKGGDTVTVLTEPIDNTAYKRVKIFFTPDSDVEYIGIRGILGGNVRLYIDDVSVKSSVCRYPETVLLNSLTDCTAQVMWENIADRYNVKISQGTPIDDLTIDDGLFRNESDWTQNSIDLTGLTPSTMYYVYIQAICDEDVSSWTDAVMFTTLCSPVDVPYNETFEETGAEDCWTVSGDGSADISTERFKDGVSSCKLSTETSMTFTSPTLDIQDIADYMFVAYVLTEETDAKVNIGVMNDPNDPSSVLPITDVTITEAGVWTEVIAYFSVLKEAGFESYSDARNVAVTVNGNVYIDNVTIDIAPKCAKPSALTLTEVDAYHVTADWKMKDVTVCLVTVTDDTGLVKELNEVTPPVTINGLMPNHQYNINVSTVCEDASSEVVSLGFKTACGDYPLPFEENFDGQESMPDCWTCEIKTDTYGNKEGAWEIIEDEGKRSSCAAFDASDGGGGRHPLQTPDLDLSNETNVVLMFNMYTKKVLYNSPKAHVVVVDGERHDTLAVGLANDGWTEYSYDLTPYCGKTISIQFVGVSDGSSGNMILLDDVYVIKTPTCPKTASMTLTGVTSSSALMSIDDESSAAAWEVAVGKRGFNPADDDTDIRKYGGKKDIVIDRLEHSTKYDAYIRVDCGEDGHSFWNGPVRFTTDCGVESLPFTENFSEYESLDEMLCYGFRNEYVSPYGSDNPKRGFSLMVSATDTALCYKDMSYGNYLILPPVDAEIESVQLSFSTKILNGTSGLVEVGVVHKDSVSQVIDMFEKLSEVSVSTDEIEPVFYFDVQPKRGRDYRIVLKVNNMATYSVQCIIDDINVQLIPSVFAPRNLTVSDIMPTSAVLGWVQASGTEKALIAIDGNYENTLEVTTGESSYMLDQLTPNTLYTVNVCGISINDNGEKDTTDWSDTYTFKTLYLPASVPYMYDFEE
ncbi:MAG: fibronectin type III domain-containing protein [bacterium]|uniref:Fibronectin type III domain-containing protein n=1 Tax=Candidatus Aphodosoma intestinipullorum TaxID=2840674 RepID=A0A940IE42_9BACT|nr:fibronectin type III domain-containing protein [Candidatus Aphodosoma intestinipullorum]